MLDTAVNVYLHFVEHMYYKIANVHGKVLNGILTSYHSDFENVTRYENKICYKVAFLM